MVFLQNKDKKRIYIYIRKKPLLITGSLYLMGETLKKNN